MGLKLENVVPWGRSLEEYSRMFDLSENDLKLNILDCAAGPASFNVEMHRQGYSVTSCDPIYQFTPAEIEKRIQDTYSNLIAGIEANRSSYIWQDIHSPTELGGIRMKAMSQFLEDFSLGLQQKRYLIDALPNLSFEDKQFDLALCSHFLFTYSEHFSEEFHLASILELCRVAKEVRVFPLLKLNGERSPYLQPLVKALNKQGCQIEIKPVNYEFQIGGNQLLVVSL